MSENCVTHHACACRLAERDRMLIAIHDAIRRPMGVIPASADEFVSDAELAAAEARRRDSATHS